MFYSRFYDLEKTIQWDAVFPLDKDPYEITYVGNVYKAELEDFASFTEKYGQELETPEGVRKIYTEDPWMYWPVRKNGVLTSFCRQLSDPVLCDTLKFFLSTGKAVLFPHIRLDEIRQQYIEHLLLEEEQNYWIEKLKENKDPQLVFPESIVYPYVRYTPHSIMPRKIFDSKDNRNIFGDLYPTPERERKPKCQISKNHLWVSCLPWSVNKNGPEIDCEEVSIDKCDREIFQSFAKSFREWSFERSDPKCKEKYIYWNDPEDHMFYWLDASPDGREVIRRRPITDYPFLPEVIKKVGKVFYDRTTYGMLESQILLPTDRPKYTDEEAKEALKNKEKWPCIFDRFPLSFITKEMVDYVDCHWKEGWFTFKDFPEHLLTENLCKKILDDYPDNVVDLPEQFRTEEMYRFAVKRDSSVFKYLPFHIQAELIRKEDFEDLDLGDVAFDLRTYDVSYRAVKQNGNNLRFVPEKFKDAYMCYAAIEARSRPGNVNWAIAYCPKCCLIREFCVDAVVHSPIALKFVPKELIDSDFIREVQRYKAEKLQ